jgi:hypothetical protein
VAASGGFIAWLVSKACNAKKDGRDFLKLSSDVFGGLVSDLSVRAEQRFQIYLVISFPDCLCVLPYLPGFEFPYKPNCLLQCHNL